MTPAEFAKELDRRADRLVAEANELRRLGREVAGLPASETRSKWVVLADAAAYLDVHIETVWRRAVHKRANTPISEGRRMVLRSSLEAGDLGVPACDQGRLHGKR